MEPGKPVPDPATERITYVVSISNESTRTESDGGVMMMDSFPSSESICFNYRFKDPTSRMAATLYHELLHIWWMNKHQSTDSGHGRDLASCGNYEPAFINNLKRFYRSLDGFATCPVATNPTPQPSPPSTPAPATPNP